MPKRPNILFLMADQQRHDALGCNGNPIVKTPNYDRLAALGVNFRNSYSSNPICVPGRASVATGCYPHKCTGVKANGGAVREGFPLLARELARSGYETYSVGKLHYLPYMPPDQPRTTYGFAHVELAESGRIIAKFDPKNERTGIEDYHDYLKEVGWGGYARGNGMGNNDVFPNVSPLPQEHYVDAWVATRTLHYLQEHMRNRSDQPFFMHASFPKPHSAFDPPHPWNKMYDPRQMPLPTGTPEHLLAQGHRACYTRRMTYQWDALSPEAMRVIKAHYYALISFQDKQVGRILDFLEAEGILENTIIVYTADHGEMLGDYGIYNKINMYNGSVRVPLMFAYPQRLKGGALCEEPATLCDIFPTLMSLADVPCDGYAVDGMDLTGVMNGGASERPFVIAQCLESPHQEYMLADKRYKYMYWEENGAEELYDQKEDIHELNNLSGIMPELTARMRAALTAWCRENGDEKMLQGEGLACTLNDSMEWKPEYGAFGRRWY